MKKLISGGVASLLVAGGLVLASASGASAHTPSVIAECDHLLVTAENYQTKPGADAVTEQRLVSEAVPYQPAVYGEPPLITPAVEYQPAVYETEYEFRHKILVWKTKWSTDPNWNAEENDHSLGWYATGETRQGALISAEVPAQDAVYGPAPLITPEVPAQDAVYETVEVTPAIPADDTPNTVEVIIDGTSLGVAEFGTSGEWFVPLAGTGHTYTVIFTAWNDPEGQHGWTKTIEGVTEHCAGPQPEDEVVVGEWVTGSYECGDTTVTETRVTTTTTYVLVDGEWVGDTTQTEETRERDLTAEEIAALECPVPPVDEEPTPEPTETPAPVVPAAATPEALAVTGGPDLSAVGITAAALLALGLALAATAAARRRHQQ